MVAFDTHSHVEELTSAGSSEAQAEAMTSLVRSSRSSADLATKADLTTIRSELEARLSRSETEVIKWVAGLIGFQTLAVLGAVVASARALRL